MTVWPTEKKPRHEITKEDLLIAKLSALAVALSAVDNSFPSFFLGIKPGLANIIVLASWKKGGMRMAAWVSLLRIFSSGILFGSLGTPGFLLSLSGGTLSLLSLKLGDYLPPKYFSLISISILAALAHYTGQLGIICSLLASGKNITHLIPVFITAAVVTGYVNGASCQYLLQRKDEP